MLSVPCHPVGSEGGHQGDRTTDLRARSEPGASVLPLAASFSTGARCRDARKGRLYTWRQASPPPGARHHLHLAPGITSIWRQASPPSGTRHRPGANQAGRYHPGRRGKTPARGVSTPGARHHLHLAPGITSIRHQASSRRQSGREISSRAPGQDARKGRLYISCEAVTQKCRDAPCGRH